MWPTPLPPVVAKALAAPPDDTQGPTVQPCPQTVSMIDSFPPGAHAETITTAPPPPPPTEQNDRSIDFYQPLSLPPTHLEARAAPVAALHDHTGEWWLPAMSLADLKAVQRADPHVGRASTLLEADTRPTPKIMRDTTDETRSLLAQWPSVHLQDGVLVRELKVDNPHPHTCFQVVAPHGIYMPPPKLATLAVPAPTTRSHAIFIGLAAHQPSDAGVWSVYPVPGRSLAQARVEAPSTRTLCLPPWSEWLHPIYWAPSLRLRMVTNTSWLPVITSPSGCRSGHYLTTTHPP